MNIDKKLDRLRQNLSSMERVVVAFSGGVDSTLLLKVAYDVLGDGVIAVTAVSGTYTKEERERASSFAKELGVKHEIISTDELSDPNFSSNPPERCYYCKSELVRTLLATAQRFGVEHVVEASNVDDRGDFRPGKKAVVEMGVASPLEEAGLTKAEIRELSKTLNLSTWDIPAAACLASRFPYGESITKEGLSRVEKAEKVLRELGFVELRVRSHGDIARIEVEPHRVEELGRKEVRSKIVQELTKLGYKYVTADLTGYRMGSMNEMLSKEERQA